MVAVRITDQCSGLEKSIPLWPYGSLTEQCNNIPFHYSEGLNLLNCVRGNESACSVSLEQVQMRVVAVYRQKCTGMTPGISEQHNAEMLLTQTM